MLGACIVHPDQSNVIPLCPELIQNTDGSEKNDCERSASKRFIEDLKREHPHLRNNYYETNKKIVGFL
jgi:hypothetical protein